MMDALLHDTAERALAAMRRAGFDAAQAAASEIRSDEVNFAHDEPSLLRSTHTCKVALAGLVDGRKASTEIATFDADALAARVAALHADALAAPRDDANAVSSGERATIVQGPQEGDVAVLADAVRDLLDFRARETPRMRLDEGHASHTLLRSRMLTSAGSELACSVGWYAMSAFGTAREGAKSSSFNIAAGTTHDLAARRAHEHFGLGAMLRDTERQIDTRGIDGKFVGEVVLTPPAVADLLGWLHGQLGDVQLIAGSSLYRERVGTRIASPLLTLESRFDAPGVVAITPDACVARPVELLGAGVLTALTPSLYGSRKTGLAHVPVAGGWALAAGDTALADVIAGVRRGALVGRLSMGVPAANGDFSAIVKNSFAIDGGAVGAALSEVMIAGNMARMLEDVSAVSRERLDTGPLLLPWLRVGGLHFS